VEATVGLPAYKTHMKLTIINVSSGDDGIYKCVAKNPRGETDGIIRLYGKSKAPKYFNFNLLRKNPWRRRKEMHCFL